MTEYAHSFSSNKQQLLSIIHTGKKASELGVLVVVGGPQYRVGSHRQFVQLARVLANDGFTTMRFDYTGMGDSQGRKAEFDYIDGDIRAAVDAFMTERPELKSIVLWGLCDAASAALMYCYQDPRISGLVLLNPWLRSEQAKGKAMLKFYYLQRLTSKDFWRKLIRGKINVSASMKDVKGFAADTVSSKDFIGGSYQRRMVDGFNKFDGKVLFLLSGNDITAKEFEQQAFSEKAWKKIKSSTCDIQRLSKADHTFSSSEWKRMVEKATTEFLKSI